MTRFIGAEDHSKKSIYCYLEFEEMLNTYNPNFFDFIGATTVKFDKVSSSTYQKTIRSLTKQLSKLRLLPKIGTHTLFWKNSQNLWLKNLKNLKST